MAVIGNAPFQGLVSGGEILDASIEGVDLSTSAIAARLGYTPVDPGAAVFSANPTISSGVANGVPYLNASKVVTTSTAVTFDGTSFKLGGGYLSFGDNGYIRADSAGWLQLQGGTSGTRIMNSSNAAAHLTITSNGFVGIGTATPNTHLHLQSNNADPFNTVDTVLTLTQGGGNTGSGTQINFTQGAGTNWIRSVVTGGNSSTGSALVFGTAATGVVGTERMRIASTGFVGIGTNNPSFILDVLGASGRFSVNPTYFTGFSTGLTAYTKRLYGGTVVDEFAYIGDMYYENSYTWKTPLTSYSATTYGSGTTIFYGGTGVTANTAFTPTERMRIAANGDLNIGTTVGGARLVVGTAETKGQSATPFTITTNDASNRFDLVVSRSTNAYYLLQAVEQNVAYRDLVFQRDGGSVGIGQTSPQEKLDVNGNIYIHTASGNPYLKIKTDGAGNNPAIRLQADTNYWDIQSTFSNTNDDLQFLYNGTNKFAFNNHSYGGLSIGNGNPQYGRLTIDTNGVINVVRGGGLNGADYYYRYLRLFKLRVSPNAASSTEVKGRLHLSRVNEIGVSTMVDFYASQGYSTQIRTWYKRVAGPGSAPDFRFVTLVSGGDTYLCLEFVSAPGWHNWQFEGSVIDYDGARGSFDVSANENLTTIELGPWASIGADPSVPLLQDTTYAPHVNGIINFDYIPAGNNITVATTHIFGAPQTSGNYGEAMRINSSGRVGIGETNPTAPLHIRGSVNNSLVASSSNFKLGTGGGDGIAMGSFEATPFGSWIQSGYLADGYNPPFNSGYPLVLNPAGGNVSIGSTRNPTAKLTVGGTVLVEATNIGNLASGSLGSVPVGVSKYAFNIQGDNTWRTLVSNFNDVRGEFIVFLSDTASGDVARYLIATTSPAYGVANMQQTDYMDGGWNTGVFEFQFRNINGTYGLEVRYSSYYASSSQGYGTIEFNRIG